MLEKLMRLFVVGILLASLPLWADEWHDQSTGYTWSYRISVYDDAVEIYNGSSSAAISPRPTGAVTIPSMLGGKTVKGIGSYAFYSCSGLTSVTIPDSVTSIGWSAFSGCSGLTSVTIPDSVTSIGGSAFSGCSGLRSVIIPDGVTSIGNSAFSGCSGLTSVTIPDSVTSIGDSAFDGCSGLFSIVVIDGNANYSSANGLLLSKDGKTLIRGVNGYVTIPASVTNIASDAFSGCSGLMSVRIPNNVTSIGSSVFNGCSGLMSIVVIDGNANYSSVNGLLLSKDGKTLIQGVNGTVTIPDSVTNIASEAFSGCSGLTSVTIPDSVTSIGSEAFTGCSGIKEVTVSQYVLNRQIRNIFQSSYLSLTNVSYSSVITKIGDSAFSGCTGLTSVTIPDSVTSIGSSAFSGCSGLTGVTIPDSVTSIGSSAFYGCSGMADSGGFVVCRDVLYDYVGSSMDVTIPNGITSIGSSAFSGCSGLTSVTIPNSVKSIGSSAFSGCNGLTSVTIPDSVWSIEDSAFYGCSGLTGVTIPNSVTIIGNSAFYGCSGLTSVTIPNSVGRIYDNAFYGCCSITNVTIPQSVCSGAWPYWGGSWQSIRQTLSGAFPSSYRSISNVVISDGVRYIGSDAFSNCSGLTSVTIPSSVTNIESGAFAWCYYLAEVHISDLAAWCGISFGDIEANPLYYAHNLYLNGELVTNLEIPEGVTSVDSAFLGRGFTSMTIPDSVTNISRSVLLACSGLTNIVVGAGNAHYMSVNGLLLSKDGKTLIRGVNGDVTIPDSVSIIGDYAFSDYSGVKSVKIPNGVTNIASSAFSGCNPIESKMRGC